jgi:hypothetical protein
MRLGRCLGEIRFFDAESAERGAECAEKNFTSDPSGRPKSLLGALCAPLSALCVEKPKLKQTPADPLTPT